MNLLRSGVLAVSAALTFLAPEPARAGDYNAEVTFRLFTASCVRRLAIADDIMTWAKDVRLAPITDADALATFVGAAQGSKGSAWILPSPNNRKFTLSIRAGTQTGCKLLRTALIAFGHQP